MKYIQFKFHIYIFLIQMLRSYIISNTPIPCEIEEGNIEYKQRLDLKDKNKIRKMASQMLWRLQEGFNNSGKSEAHYFLGIKDNGEFAQITSETIDSSVEIIREVCAKCQAKIMNIDKIMLPDNFCVAEVIVCKKADGNFIKESRVCFLGSSGHGKTTLISHLTFNQLDNGNGLARSLVLKHMHEQHSGFTSSIKHDIVGIKNNKLVNYKSDIHTNWENIVLRSDKIIALTDLPGKNKYYKTTLNALFSLKPHFNVIVICPSECFIDQECVIGCEIINSIKLCVFLNIPFVIVFTGCDIMPLDDMFINKFYNVISEHVQNKKLCQFINNIHHNNIYYIGISNVNNNNFDNLITLLDLYSEKYNNKNRKLYDEIDHKTEFMIHDTYLIPDRGNIIYGVMNKGHIDVSENYFIGPINNNFFPITIRTIHKKQIDSKNMFEDETASIEIKSNDKLDLGKNLFIIDNPKNVILDDNICIELLSQSNFIKIGSQFMFFCDNIVEPVIIESIDDKYVKMIMFKKVIKPKKNKKICLLETFSNNIIFGKIFC